MLLRLQCAVTSPRRRVRRPLAQRLQVPPEVLRRRCAAAAGRLGNGLAGQHLRGARVHRQRTSTCRAVLPLVPPCSGFGVRPAAGCLGSGRAVLRAPPSPSAQRLRVPPDVLRRRCAAAAGRLGAGLGDGLAAGGGADAGGRRAGRSRIALEPGAPDGRCRRLCKGPRTRPRGASLSARPPASLASGRSSRRFDTCSPALPEEID